MFVDDERHFVQRWLAPHAEPLVLEAFAAEGLAQESPLGRGEWCMRSLKENEKLTIVYIAGWLLVIVVQYLRANTEHDGALTVVYGVAPNFVLGFCAPSLFFLYRTRALRRFPGLSDSGWFRISAALGVGGGVAWELLQPWTANLVFDGSDIVATLLGGLALLGCWPLVRKHIVAG